MKILNILVPVPFEKFLSKEISASLKGMIFFSVLVVIIINSMNLTADLAAKEPDMNLTEAFFSVGWTSVLYFIPYYLIAFLLRFVIEYFVVMKKHPEEVKPEAKLSCDMSSAVPEDVEDSEWMKEMMSSNSSEADPCIEKHLPLTPEQEEEMLHSLSDTTENNRTIVGVDNHPDDEGKAKPSLIEDKKDNSSIFLTDKIDEDRFASVLKENSRLLGLGKYLAMMYYVLCDKGCIVENQTHFLKYVGQYIKTVTHSTFSVSYHKMLSDLKYEETALANKDEDVSSDTIDLYEKILEILQPIFLD